MHARMELLQVLRGAERKGGAWHWVVGGLLEGARLASAWGLSKSTYPE